MAKKTGRETISFGLFGFSFEGPMPIALGVALLLIGALALWNWPMVAGRFTSKGMDDQLAENRSIQIDLCQYRRVSGTVIACVPHGACSGPDAVGLGFAIDKTSIATAEYSCKQACASEASDRRAQCSTLPPY
jgi:hypothetical protein